MRYSGGPHKHDQYAKNDAIRCSFGRWQLWEGLVGARPVGARSQSARIDKHHANERCGLIFSTFARKTDIARWGELPQGELLLLVYPAAFHDEADAFQRRDIVKRVAGDGNNVGLLARCERSMGVTDPEEIRGNTRR